MNGGCYRRHHCPLSRTFFLCTPDRRFLDAEQAVLEGMEAGLGVARPGNRCEDIANAFFDVLARHRSSSNTVANREGCALATTELSKPRHNQQGLMMDGQQGAGLRPSAIVPTVDFDAEGVQHGFLRLPYSRDDSAWGSVMIPIAVARCGDGPTARVYAVNRTGLAPAEYCARMDSILVPRHFPGLCQSGDCIAVLAAPL